MLPLPSYCEKETMHRSVMVHSSYHINGSITNQHQLVISSDEHQDVQQPHKSNEQVQTVMIHDKSDTAYLFVRNINTYSMVSSYRRKENRHMSMLPLPSYCMKENRHMSRLPVASYCRKENRHNSKRPIHSYRRKENRLKFRLPLPSNCRKKENQHRPGLPLLDIGSLRHRRGQHETKAGHQLQAGQRSRAHR